MRNHMNYADYIDITGTLDITDYYKTDTHWRQEKLPETAAVLAEGMGTSISGAYTEYALDVPFYWCILWSVLLFHCRRKRYIIYPMMF